MKQKQVPAFAVACSVLLLFCLSGCTNAFMDWILGGKNSAEGPWMGPPGTGTAGDPFIVWNVETLQKVGTGEDGWNLDAHYRQERHIDMAGVAFTPIGKDNTAPFTGTYTGQGISNNNERRAILNLAVNNPGADYQGLFGYINGSGGKVINVTLINCTITGESYVAGIVGQNQGGTVRNSSFTGAVVGTYNNTGGIVGINQGGTVDNCSSLGSVTNTIGVYVGGVVGNNDGGTVQNSHSASIVKGTDYAGGVAGSNTTSSTVLNCYSTGSVTGTGNVGGVVGYNNPATADVKNCYATGAIKGDRYVGGVVGYNNGGKIENCYSASAVKSDTDCAGGIAGISMNQYIKNCYSTGNITGQYDVGGIVGKLQGYGNVEQCYATGTIKGGFNTGGIAGTIESLTTLSGCIALNKQIDSPGPDTGRVVGNNVAGGALLFNYAYEDIQDDTGFVPPWPFNSTSAKDGDGKTKYDLQNVIGFLTGFDTAPWTYKAGWLPGLFGQVVPMPAYLRLP